MVREWILCLYRSTHLRPRYRGKIFWEMRIEYKKNHLTLRFACAKNSVEWLQSHLCAAFISHDWINYHCRKGGIEFAYSFILVSHKSAHNKNLSAKTYILISLKHFLKVGSSFCNRSLATSPHYMNVGCMREPTCSEGHHLVDSWQAWLSHPALSPFSHSFSKIEQ